MRIEWRSNERDSDTLLVVDEQNNTVQQAWKATAPLLEDFLNEMERTPSEEVLDTKGTPEFENPDSWGNLVIARLDTGHVIGVDPELYWNRVTDLFRARGQDPHAWVRRK